MEEDKGVKSCPVVCCTGSFDDDANMGASGHGFFLSEAGKGRASVAPARTQHVGQDDVAADVELDRESQGPADVAGRTTGRCATRQTSNGHDGASVRRSSAESVAHRGIQEAGVPTREPEAENRQAERCVSPRAGVTVVAATAPSSRSGVPAVAGSAESPLVQVDAQNGKAVLPSDDGSLDPANRSAPTSHGALMDHIVVVGDSGSGKSTLLTAMAGGRARFQSGPSYARGLTDKLQTVVVDGKRYSDTPGLDDQEMWREAAVAIEGAFHLGGIVRLVFVLTLESGRLRGSNLVTMRVVLDTLAAKGFCVNGSFSAIINKMTPAEMDQWNDPARSGHARLQRHMGSAHSLGPLLYLPLDRRIQDVSNGELPHELHLPIFLFGARVPGIFIPQGTRVFFPTDVSADVPDDAVEDVPSTREQGSRGHAADTSRPGKRAADRQAGGDHQPSPPPDGRHRNRSASSDGAATAQQCTCCLKEWRRFLLDASRRDDGGGRPRRGTPARGHSRRRSYSR